MRLRWLMCCLLGAGVLAFGVHCVPQTDAVVAQDAAAYRLKVAVDEVELTFHAADVQGLPSNGLKLDDVRLLDNGVPPLKVLEFRLLQDVPVRAGILVDTSDSMREVFPVARSIAETYAQTMLRQQTDEAFVAEFGRVETVVLPWTSDPSALTEGVRTVTMAKADPISGTAMYDAIFRTCLYQFGEIDHAASGNFILLFSDGEDNASHVTLKDAVDMCQRSNTAIYDFRRLRGGASDAAGTANLLEMAQETGGRMFLDDGSGAGVNGDLRIIENEMRNRYRIVYRPAEMKHDGSFHSIRIETPTLFDTVDVPSGYYAPTR
jgi:Ca-activated chloride channel family protein